jgi:hypothetical protein
MKGVDNLTKWESVIEWFDERKYSKLSEKTKSELKRFRSLNHYIQTLKKSIDVRENEISKLKGEIIKKKDSIRKHKLEGNNLFEKLVYLKKKSDITVYYSEGTSKKKLKGDKWSRGVSEKIYPQTNLKYKSRNTKTVKTISLKSTRLETLNEIKKVFPKWYNQVGKNLIELNWENRVEGNRLKNEFTLLFKPLIEELIEKNKSKSNTKGEFNIQFDKLMELLKKKKVI